MTKNTEEKIIEKTIENIQQDGYQKISLRKIANQVGLTTGAFYKHFRNKDELFYRVSLDLSKRVTEKMDMDDNETASQQLLTIAQQFCQLFQDQPRIMNFLFFNPSLAKVYQQTESTEFPFLTLAKQLAYQVNPGYLDDQQFFNQIWSFIQGYSLLINNGITSYDSKLVALTLDQLMGGKD